MGTPNTPEGANTIFTIDSVDDSVNEFLRQRKITAAQVSEVMNIALDEETGGPQRAMERLTSILESNQ